MVGHTVRTPPGVRLPARLVDGRGLRLVLAALRVVEAKALPKLGAVVAVEGRLASPSCRQDHTKEGMEVDVQRRDIALDGRRLGPEVDEDTPVGHVGATLTVVRRGVVAELGAEGRAVRLVAKGLGVGLILVGVPTVEGPTPPT